MSLEVLEKDFSNKGLRLAGRLYLPMDSSRPPVVVMAHGFGARMSFGLEAFAGCFVRRGLAVFMFDYRNFGQSQGMPRNLVHPFHHLSDWRAALAHVRRLREVDSQRLGLWGTSFSGGHVLVTAAGDHGVKAVVSQIPFVDGRDALWDFGFGFTGRALVAAFADYALSFIGASPYWVAMTAVPGVLSPLSKHGCHQAFLKLMPEDCRQNWKNRVPARAFLLTALYRPIKCVSRITCPVLYVIAEKDNLIRSQSVLKAARMTPQARVRFVKADHFQPYFEPVFKSVAQAEADFLARRLMA